MIHATEQQQLFNDMLIRSTIAVAKDNSAAKRACQVVLEDGDTHSSDSRQSH